MSNVLRFCLCLAFSFLFFGGFFEEMSYYFGDFFFILLLWLDYSQLFEEFCVAWDGISELEVYITFKKQKLELNKKKNTGSIKSYNVYMKYVNYRGDIHMNIPKTKNPFESFLRSNLDLQVSSSTVHRCVKAALFARSVLKISVY